MEIAGKTHGEEWLTLFQHVSEAYFRVLRIELKRGRPFSEAEVDDARKVAVVNETFVRRYLPGEEPNRAARAAREGSGPAVPGSQTRGSRSSASWQTWESGGLQVPIDPEVWMPYTITGSARETP